MSPVTTVIPTVTTEDAAPTVAPHKISRDAAHTTVSAPFTPTHDGQLVPSGALLPNGSTLFPAAQVRPVRRPSASLHPGSGYPAIYPDAGLYPDRGGIVPGWPRDMVGYVVREGGVDASTGKRIHMAGIRAGGAPCSPTRVASEQDWRSSSGAAIGLTFTFADADDGGADGARQINVYATAESQGTS